MKFNIKQAQKAAEDEELKSAEELKNDFVQQKKAEGVAGVKSITSNNDDELAFNKKHREDYETLMDESSTKLDGYWDSKNVFVKLLLFILGIIIVLGCVYYFMTYYSTMK